jgi:rSAM/selenodomain-associated transferase 1
LCFAPDDQTARDYFQSLGREDYELWPQPAGSLGDRLAMFFDDVFNSGAGQVVVIGSDSPTLPLGLVAYAFTLLKDNDCVLGPAVDGGYYLIGQRGRSRPLFAGIEWSTPRVLLQTARAIADCDASLAVLPPWYDVDTPADVEMLAGHVRALDLWRPEIDLDRTRAWLEAGWDTANAARFL